ncbi:MAG: DUF1376 domain-containing protein [Mesorhizobium sp.]
MSTGLPWVRFFPSDWLAGTRGLSAHSTAAYITILAMIYERNGPIKNDPDLLARSCAMTRRQFDAALAALIEKRKLLLLDSGELWNERAAAEIEKRIKAREIQIERANKRWGKKDNKNSADNMPPHATGIAEHMPIKNQNQNHIEKEEEANASSKKKRTATRLSEDWKISPEWLAEAVQEGLPHSVAVAEAEP